MAEAAPRLILAADVGGTKTDVGVFAAGDPPSMVRSARYLSRDYAGLDELIADFIGSERIEAAGVAAAGPVLGEEIRPTNLAWVISAGRIASDLGGAPVCLLNDLEVAATGVLGLDASGLRRLHPGVARDAHRAILAPGTGLGQGLLLRVQDGYRPSASEGGHVGFSPRDEEQIELLRFLRARYAQVSLEHILSGSGLANIFDFVDGELGVEVADSVRKRLSPEDRGAVIGEAAVAGDCPASAHSVALFARVLAARAGDLALSLLALGGIYIGGGMMPKLLTVIDAAEFCDVFVGHGPFAPLLAKIPVDVVIEPKVALLGAAAAASRRLQ